MKRDDPWSYLGLVTELGWTMAGSVLAGLGLGWFVGQWIGGAASMVIGILAGVVAGFFMVYRLVMRSGIADDQHE